MRKCSLNEYKSRGERTGFYDLWLDIRLYFVTRVLGSTIKVRYRVPGKPKRERNFPKRTYSCEHRRRNLKPKTTVLSVLIN